MNIGIYTVFGYGNPLMNYFIYKYTVSGKVVKVGEVEKHKPTKLKLPNYLLKHLNLQRA